MPAACNSGGQASWPEMMSRMHGFIRLIYYTNSYHLLCMGQIINYEPGLPSSDHAVMIPQVNALEPFTLACGASVQCNKIYKLML